MDKKYFILDRLIRQYLKKQEPISSKELVEILEISLSSATVRYYFQKLSSEGLLAQEHKSSGRIPTPVALKAFWYTHLKRDSIEVKDKKEFLENAVKFNIFSEYGFYKNVAISNVEVLKDKFIVLGIGSDEIVLPHNIQAEKFLCSQIGKSAFEVGNLCIDVGMVHIGKRIKEAIQSDFSVANVEEMVQVVKNDRMIIDIISGSKFLSEKIGVKFYNNFLSYKFFIKLDKKFGEMLLIGHLSRDFDNFIKNLEKGEHNGKKRVQK